MAATRARVGLQLIKSTTPRSLVYTNLSNEQTYFSPPSGGDYILKWDDAATDLTWLSTSSLINIYNNDGALSSSRTLTGGTNTLNFNFNDGVSYNSDYVANSVLQYLTVIDTALDTSASVEVSPYSVILSAIDNLSSRQAQLSLGIDITLYRSGAVGANSITFSDTGMLVTDSNTSQGLKYAADYAAYFATNPRSIPDVGWVNAAISAIPNLWTDAGVFTRLTSTTDRLVIGSATELDTNFKFQVSGAGLFSTNLAVQGDMFVGATSAAGVNFRVNKRQNDIGVIPVSIGSSGNGYPIVGYNVQLQTTANTYNYKSADPAFMIDLGTVGGNRVGIRVAAAGTAGNPITFTEALSVLTNGNVGIGVTAPNAALHLKAGTTSFAPLIFTAGTNTSAVTAGAHEWDGTRLYMTQTSGPTRQTLAYLTDTISGVGSGVANQWAYWSGSGTLTTSNILVNTSNYLDTSNSLGLMMPSKTFNPNQPRTLFVRSDMSDLMFYRQSNSTYLPIIMGRDYVGTQGSWTSKKLNAPELFDIMAPYALWNVTDSGTTAAGGTYVRTYTLSTTYSTSGVVYPAGEMFLRFWSNNYPTAISIRVKNDAGTWYGPYAVNMTSVTSNDYGVNNGLFMNMYKWNVQGIGNYLRAIEVTFTNQPSVSLNFQGLSYFPDSAEGVNSAYPFISKALLNIDLTNHFRFFDAGTVKTFLGFQGSYFTGLNGANSTMAVGSSTFLSNTSLTVVNPISDSGGYFALAVRNRANSEIFNVRGDGVSAFGALAATNKRVYITGLGNTSGTAALAIRNSSNSLEYFSANDDATIYLGRFYSGGSSQAVYIGHNGTTTSSNDGTATIKFVSQYGNFPFTMGAEGNGYNFWTRQTNGGQGTMGWDFGTISSTLYQKNYTYVTDHYEDIYTGKWLMTFSGTGTGGNYFGVNNTVTSNGTSTLYDTYRISKSTTGNWPLSIEPLISFFNGSTTGAVTAISRYVSRINRLGFLGIGTDISTGTTTRGHQAGLTIDIPSRSGVLTGDGTTAINVRTIGSSTTVVFPNNSNSAIPIGIQVGSRITANGITRTVVNLIDHTAVTVDSAVNWDNGGVGYTFTYTNAFISLQDGSNKYLVVDGLGNTGLNTGTPTQRLDVNGGMRLRGPLYDYTNSPGTVDMIMVSLNTTGAQWQSLATLNVPTGSGADTQIAYYVGGHSITSENGTGLDSFTWDYNNNRLGVRVASPLSTLHLNNGIDTSAYAIFTGSLTGSTNVTSLALNRTAGSGSLDLIQTHSGTGDNCVILQGNGVGDMFYRLLSSGPGVSYNMGIDASDNYTFKINNGLTPSSGNTLFSGLGAKVGIRTNPHGTQDIYMLGTLRLDLGSDATGDVYYRNSSGAFTRLAAGTNGHVLKLASGIPSWSPDLDGIYSGSGSLSGATTVTQGNNNLQFLASSGAGHSLSVQFQPTFSQFYVSAQDTTGVGPVLGELNITEGYASMSVGDDLIPTTTLTGISFANTGSNWNWGPLSITIDGSGIHVDTAGFDGFIYAADYSASILANNRSIPDIFTVRENAIENYNTITSTSSPLNLNGLAPDYLIAQGGTQATFTFSLPATPDDGEICKLTFSTAVTTLTITAQGGITILGTAATTAAIGTQLEYKYYSTISAWIRTK